MLVRVDVVLDGAEAVAQRLDGLLDGRCIRALLCVGRVRILADTPCAIDAAAGDFDAKLDDLAGNGRHAVAKAERVLALRLRDKGEVALLLGLARVHHRPLGVLDGEINVKVAARHHRKLKQDARVGLRCVLVEALRVVRAHRDGVAAGQRRRKQHQRRGHKRPLHHADQSMMK